MLLGKLRHLIMMRRGVTVALRLGQKGRDIVPFDDRQHGARKEEIVVASRDHPGQARALPSPFAPAVPKKFS